jgi:hypothetical protein
MEADVTDPGGLERTVNTEIERFDEIDVAAATQTAADHRGAATVVFAGRAGRCSFE